MIEFLIQNCYWITACQLVCAGDHVPAESGWSGRQWEGWPDRGRGSQVLLLRHIEKRDRVEEWRVMVQYRESGVVSSTQREERQNRGMTRHGTVQGARYCSFDTKRRETTREMARHVTVQGARYCSFDRKRRETTREMTRHGTVQIVRCCFFDTKRRETTR